VSGAPFRPCAVARVAIDLWRAAVPDGLPLAFLLPGTRRQLGRTSRKCSQTSTRAGLNSRVPQDYFRQVLQIENSGLPTMESNMQYDWYTLWQLTS
jgi:hypothetical protein